MNNNNNNKRNRIPRGYLPEDSERRLEWLKNERNFELKNLPPNETEELKGIIENHIGYMQMPMAIAGPVMIDGKYARGEFTIPLCTIEGSLAASMNRGLYASSLCGGMKTKHFRQELSRSPIFIFDDLKKSDEFQNWVTDHLEEITKAAQSTTQYGKVLRIDQYAIQNYVLLDFILDTGNAAGQNMVTLATNVACEYIRQETGHKFFLDSNFASDKKASSRNMILGRGHGVIAETHITKSVMSRVLNVDPDFVIENWTYFPIVSAMAGTLGNAIHASNALTAIYIATGQDTACVAENSVGHFTIEKVDDGITWRLTLPSMTVGTVGGGTRLNQQQQNLKLLGCDSSSEHSSKKLAEIIAAAALGLEISLGSAIMSHTWTSAHMKYGRK
jgi:hydroxymethylglutaryl-CoA reductase (NADPH)|tara:strand:+ start:1014 stop:2177 length:1164 start_codon:yes stop_codon:yes gene_type:complete